MSSSTSRSTSSSKKRVEQVLQDLDFSGKIGQLSQIDINILVTEDKTSLRQDLLDHYIGELGFGSVLNLVTQDVDGGAVKPKNIWKSRDYRKAVIQIQDTAAKYGRPPVIWGLDSVHGANYIYGKISTPQPLNLAASFNISLAYQAGRLASRDTRQAGISWLFSPLIGIAWEPLWSRVYETFGEDPVVVGSMAKKMIQGIQEPDVDTNTTTTTIPSRAAASAKHFVGYSNPHNGHDRSPSWIPTRHLYQYFLPPWKQILGEVETVMESYTEIDGVPNVANRNTLDVLLRRRMGFQGVLVTDYAEIYNLADWHHTAENRTMATLATFQEGTVDMSMIPREPDDFVSAMHSHQHEISMDRIDTSVRRVLQLKENLHMWDETVTMENIYNTVKHPNSNTNDEEQPSSPSEADDGPPSPQDLELALDMTQQSIILAQNKNGALPLAANEKLKVLVTGPTSDSLSYQSGGWTGQWQGIDPSKEQEWFTYGSTVYGELLLQKNKEGWDVSYQCGTDILGGDCQDADQDDSAQDPSVLDKVKGWVGLGGDDDASSYYAIVRAIHAAKDMDVVVVCVGEENYAEKPGDIRSLRLPQGQYELVAGLRQNTNAKIVLVHFGGRPRLLKDMVENVDAVLLGFLPGPLAGQAVVDILTGRVNPSARLPITYPKFEDGGGIPYMHAVSDMCTKDTDGPLPHWENQDCEVQWPFGHGLSYTSFEYSGITLNTNELKYRRRQSEDPVLTVSVNVQNSGDRAGADTVLLFTFDEFRSTTPESKRLRAFEKVWLEPGETRAVNFTIALDDLRFVGPHDDTHYILQNGMKFRVGVADADCRHDPDIPACSAPVTITTDDDYVGACEAACNTWAESGCSKYHHMTMDKCWDLCGSIHQDSSNELQMNNDGWGWNYVNCIEELTWGNKFHKDSTQCWKMTSFCRDVISTAHMDELGHGSTPPAFENHAVRNSAALILAVIAGLVSSVMIFHAVRGGFSKRDDRYGGEDVEFSVVHAHELM